MHLHKITLNGSKIELHNSCITSKLVSIIQTLIYYYPVYKKNEVLFIYIYKEIMGLKEKPDIVDIT